ncbi:hypothetical protein BDFB_008743 [Asbolus verrucosus]|uniref:Uncharacterized protein n=1 Tax=Asbolus verrucosus TaxID=1661398 RepID=A0A482VCN3_ASBVE|nr:hypothetical protein BDFB_008743 [Asbolus verrucosus]
MVVTRWESSSRPLFVRTVWRDGHRHVVLREDDVASPARTSRRSVSSTSRRSAKPPPTPDNSGFKVPSVKLLLAGWRGPKTRRCKTEARSREYVKTAITIDIIPSDSVRYSDINKQVSFDNVKKLSAKSSSFEVTETPPPFSYDNYCVEQFASLSERVMIWLDLAIQNHKQFKNIDVKKRPPTCKKNSFDGKYNPREKNLEERQKSVKDVSVLERAPPLVTSHMECEEVEAVNLEQKPKLRGTAKRQLHIFLPNLPKKSSESSSLLSSKASSFQINKT